MKIAVALDTDSSVSRHFGRTSHYLIATAETGTITDRDMRNATRLHGLTDRSEDHQHSHVHSHDDMIRELSDCTALICGGIGPRAVADLGAKGLRVYLTDQVDPELALKQMLDGHLDQASPDQSCKCNH
jgi:predicted Fe-Mo cluster-binding NifX family protein